MSQTFTDGQIVAIVLFVLALIPAYCAITFTFVWGDPILWLCYVVATGCLLVMGTATYMIFTPNPPDAIAVFLRGSFLYFPNWFR